MEKRNAAASGKRQIDAACGRIKADLVFKNASFVNVFTERIEQADVAVCEGRIVGIGAYDGEREIDLTDRILAPGFIDGHIHLESSMVSPAEFARAVVPHGTSAVVTDPHEIANVCGTDGIDYMIEATEDLPLDVYFTLSSCVPSTPLDESGACLGAADLEPYYACDRVVGLAEMMNYVGCTAGDADILEKICGAKRHGRVVDGHAPGLNGKDLCGYLTAGIASDHECAGEEEARERVARGQWVMVREGTAAKNLEALVSLLDPPYHQRTMLATDDKHPNDLLELGHMDYIVRRAVSLGADPCRVIKCATLSAASYFGLRGKGAIAPGYAADLVVLDNLKDFSVQQVYKNGKLVAENGAVTAEVLSGTSRQSSADAGEDASVRESDKADRSKTAARLERVMHSFHCQTLKPEDFIMAAGNTDAAGVANERGDAASAGTARGETPPQPGRENMLRVIGMIPGQILTEKLTMPCRVQTDGIDTAQDILKLAVIERHKNTGHIGLGYIHGYGLQSGAIASSVAHDSHNIIVIGTNEADMSAAANDLIAMQGGWSIARDGQILGHLPLPIAGLMSDQSVAVTAKQIDEMKAIAAGLGVSADIDPFMTLAFVSLTVIPAWKLSTHGLVDVASQQVIPLQVDDTIA